MRRARRPPVGSVVQLSLPDGRFAYGRVLEDASIAIYSDLTDQPGRPPIGDRRYLFVVGIYDDVLTSGQVPVIGVDPAAEPEQDWPPPMCVKDVVSGAYRLYHKGRMTPSTEEECRGLEPAAVWDLHHIIERIMREAG